MRSEFVREGQYGVGILVTLKPLFCWVIDVMFGVRAKLWQGSKWAQPLLLPFSQAKLSFSYKQMLSKYLKNKVLKCVKYWTAGLDSTFKSVCLPCLSLSSSISHPFLSSWKILCRGFHRGSFLCLESGFLPLHLCSDQLWAWWQDQVDRGSCMESRSNAK